MITPDCANKHTSPIQHMRSFILSMSYLLEIPPPIWGILASDWILLSDVPRYIQIDRILIIQHADGQATAPKIRLLLDIKRSMKTDARLS